MPATSSEHANCSKNNFVLENFKEECNAMIDPASRDCAENNSKPSNSSNNKASHDAVGGESKLNAETTLGSHPKTMSSSCVAAKNGNDDQNDLSLSSTSSSSSSATAAKNSTSTDSEKKSKNLKSLIKKRNDATAHQDIIRTHNKRVKFSETMQVFCYELPDNQMPQIIALKSPAELNFMEFQPFMFEPPAEYQDFLTFEPPPDYRDFIANSLNVFRNEVTFDYIEDDGEEDSESANGDDAEKATREKKGNHISSLVITKEANGPNSKWQSMILDNNLDSLEEEQIIGVLKEDDILQAIGSQITLPVSSDPNGSMDGDVNDQQTDSKAYAYKVLDSHEHFEENFSSEDFPVHHLNSYLLQSSGNIDEEEEDACFIDSSPNGSLQDLASDSSITSQDTIILINQNKTFHLEPLGGIDALASNQGQHKQLRSRENIYENVQQNSSSSSSSSCQLSQPNSSGKLTSDESKQEDSFNTNQEKRDITLPPDKPESGEQKKTFLCEVLYENTNDLLTNAASVATPSATGSQTNSESRSNISTSNDDDKTFEQGGENTRGVNSNASKFKQNLMFYESMMQQQQQQQQQNASATSIPAAALAVMSNPPAPLPPSSSSSSVNNKHVAGENGRSDGGPNAQQHKVMVGVTNAEAAAAIASNRLAAIPVRLPPALYTIVDANRASPSSSSLSSTSSSSSSFLSCAGHPMQISPQALPTSSIAHLSVNVPLAVPPAQISPNSSSSSSSSSVPPEYLPQFGPKICANFVSAKSGATGMDQTHGNCRGSAITNDAANFAVPLLNEPLSMNVSFGGGGSAGVGGGMSQLPTQQQPQLPQQLSAWSRPSGSICVVNNASVSAPIRAGQVVYRYPYAFIQQQANGISTIRPVQCIVQTNPQTGSQSVLYNPRFVINNQPYTISQAASNNPNGPASLIGNCTAGGFATAPPAANAGAAVTTSTPTPSMPNNGTDSPKVSIPIRRILLPQGATMLAPRIMHLHPQHKQAPPPYQYYVQQKQQQAAAILACQQGVQLRPASPAQVQSVQVGVAPNHHHGHTEFPNPSEIRRRDGLYAYPQVFLKAEGKNSSQSAKGGDHAVPNGETDRDELEEFVQQEQQRTERIKKRYSFTEDDDPTFGFARRPSVRGIRPKFGTTNEIIQQMTSTIPRPVLQQKVVMTTSNSLLNQQQQQQQPQPTAFAYSTIPKNASFINLNSANAINSSVNSQMISFIGKQMGNLQLRENGSTSASNVFKSQTLPRSSNGGSTLVAVSADGNILSNGSNVNLNSLQHDPQLKLQIQKQLERQIKTQKQQQLQQQQQQPQCSSNLHVPPDGGSSSYSPNHPVVGIDHVATASFNSSAIKVDPKAAVPSLVNENVNNSHGTEAFHYSMNV